MRKLILLVNSASKYGCRLALSLFLLLSSACGAPPAEVVEIYGATMGTRYSVRISSNVGGISPATLQTEIAQRLLEINKMMSTYDDHSELTRFNKARGDEWVSVSPELAGLIDIAGRIYQQTNGAFDISVGPLVNLWGFGPQAVVESPPETEQIKQAKARVGMDKLQVRLQGQPALKKSKTDVYLDLSAIAKGYAVDQLADLLEQSGVTHYLIEIGGEIRARGKKPDGSPWKVAVEKPHSESQRAEVVLAMSEGALATSGSYRNYWEYAGERYSHAINPNTGRPVDHNLLSVTVRAQTAMLADAIATALLVMGPESGYTWAQTHQINALFIGAESGNFWTRTTDPRFDKAVE